MRVSELNALPWQEVNSTNIARMAYKPLVPEDGVGYPPGTDGQLFVHFFADGEQTVYRYFDVPEAVYRSLAGARSVGGMHAKIVRDKFRYERVDVEPDPVMIDGEVIEEPDPVVIALGILADRIAAMEAEVSNLVRLITAARRPRPPTKEKKE